MNTDINGSIFQFTYGFIFASPCTRSFFQTTPCDTNSSIQTCILAAGFNGYQVTKLQRASQTFF